jgi:hypothetical protein
MPIHFLGIGKRPLATLDDVLVPQVRVGGIIKQNAFPLKILRLPQSLKIPD